MTKSVSVTWQRLARAFGFLVPLALAGCRMPSTLPEWYASPLPGLIPLLDHWSGNSPEKPDSSTVKSQLTVARVIAAEPVRWPNSDAKLGFVQAVNEYMLTITLDAPLCNSAVVKTRGYGADALATDAAGKFRAQNAHSLIGTYISAGRCMPFSELTSTPDEALSCESVYTGAYRNLDLPGSWYWLQSGAARNHVADAIAAEIWDRHESGAYDVAPSYVFVDELHHNTAWGSSGISWTSTCAYLTRLRANLMHRNLRLVANVALSPWILSDADRARFLQTGTDGWCCEMPFEKAYGRTQVARVVSELRNYRLWLDAERLLLLVPTGGDTDSLIADAHFIAAALLLIRQPGDCAFVMEYPFNPQPWDDWPARLGAPLETYRVSGEELSRAYANGHVRVWPLESRWQVEINP